MQCTVPFLSLAMRPLASFSAFASSSMLLFIFQIKMRPLASFGVFSRDVANIFKICVFVRSKLFFDGFAKMSIETSICTDSELRHFIHPLTLRPLASGFLEWPGPCGFVISASLR